MEQRDYLMKQFEQLGVVLAALMGFKSRTEYKKAIEIIHEAYNVIPGFDLDLLNIQDPDIFLEKLLEESPHSRDKMGLIADFLFEEGDFLYLSGDRNKSRDRLFKAESIFNFLNINQKIFSIERENKMSRIRKILSED